MRNKKNMNKRRKNLNSMIIKHIYVVNIQERSLFQRVRKGTQGERLRDSGWYDQIQHFSLRQREEKEKGRLKNQR